MTICFSLASGGLHAQDQRFDRNSDHRDDRQQEVVEVIERNLEDETDMPRNQVDRDSDLLANALKRALVSRNVIEPDDTLAIQIDRNNEWLRIVIETSTPRDTPRDQRSRRDASPTDERSSNHRRTERHREIRRETTPSQARPESSRPDRRAR